MSKTRANPFESITIPDGVTIIPFSSYSEVGYASETEDGIERDRLGVKTIELRGHNTDYVKTNLHGEPFARPSVLGPSKKKKKSKRTGPTGIWYEDWEDNPHKLGNGGAPYPSDLNDVDRVRRATSDFRRGDQWPVDPILGNNFDKFQTFIGTIGYVPVSNDFAMDDDSDDGVGVDSQDAPEDSSGALWRFCNNPAKAIKIFFSSYMDQAGLIYDAKACINLPKLVHFYLDYLKRTYALKPRPLEDALRWLDDVEEQLSLQVQLAQAIQNGVGPDLEAMFEQYPDMMMLSEYIPVVANNGDDGEVEWKGISQTKEEWKGIQRDAIRMETDSAPAASEDEPEAPSSGWGNSFPGTNTWSNVSDTASASAWDTPTTEATWGSSTASGGWGDASSDSEPADTNTWSAPSPKTSFMRWVDCPTALPLTHTPGIVETSMREVIDIIPPTGKTAAKSPLATEPNADAVEADLESKLYRIVLRPWNDLVAPEVHRFSKGPIVSQDAAFPDKWEGARPHHIGHHDITILQDKETAKVWEKCKGMRVSATWTQMARISDFEETSNKRKKSKRQERFWYLARSSATFVSYYTVSEE